MQQKAVSRSIGHGFLLVYACRYGLVRRGRRGTVPAGGSVAPGNTLFSREGRSRMTFAL